VDAPESPASSHEDARKFIFIAGAEGSGTTVLLRLLSSPPGYVSLGGSHFKYPRAAKELVGAFDAANHRLWDRKESFAAHAQARLDWHAANAAILASPIFAGVTRFFFKRSFPFDAPRDQYAPDMWDIYDLWRDARTIVIYRDPRAAAYSAFRRGFDTDIRRIAVVCSEQLTWIAAQVSAIGRERFTIVSYSELCVEPLKALAPLAALTDTTAGEIEAAVAREGVKAGLDDRWSRELPPEEMAWLNEFFDARRLRQWAVLAKG
jgi:hypothetical protein